MATAEDAAEQFLRLCVDLGAMGHGLARSPLESKVADSGTTDHQFDQGQQLTAHRWWHRPCCSVPCDLTPTPHGYGPGHW